MPQCFGALYPFSYLWCGEIWDIRSRQGWMRIFWWREVATVQFVERCFKPPGQHCTTFLTQLGPKPLPKDYLCFINVRFQKHAAYGWRHIPLYTLQSMWSSQFYCPACQTIESARGSWDVVMCPINMCLTVYEFSFILFDVCLFITIFIFNLKYVLIVIFWIFTFYRIWILLNIYCFIWSYWIIYFVTCLEVFWSVMS